MIKVKLLIVDDEELSRNVIKEYAKLENYEVDEADLSAVHVAEQLGEDVDCVFKTLVLEGDKVKHFVCVIPGAMELDLKKAARISGNKSCDLIPMKELLPLTGYIRGACSPIGMKKPFPTYIDETCQLFDSIYVSAGQRGLQLHLRTADLHCHTIPGEQVEPALPKRCTRL